MGPSIDFFDAKARTHLFNLRLTLGKKTKAKALSLM